MDSFAPSSPGSRVGVPGSRFWSPYSVVQAKDASGTRDGGIRTRWTRRNSPTQILVWLCEMLIFRVCDVRRYFYVFSLYRNPDLYDRLFDSLPTSMAVVKAEDVRASFLFVGVLNGHRQE